MGNTPVKNGRRLDPRLLIGVIATLYGMSPIDGIPDVVPVLGQLDDGAIAVLAVVFILLMTVIGDKGDDNA